MSIERKNPLRQLASQIVSACKEKGLKHTVVLDTLTKHAGYRSHQASDNVTSPSRLIQPVCGSTIYLQGVLFANYPDADILPLRLQDILGRLVTEEEVGDRAFSDTWNALTSAPKDFKGYINVVQCELRILADEAEGAAERNDIIEASLYHWIGRRQLSDVLKAFMYSEISERGEGLAGQDWLVSIYDTVSRLIEEYHGIQASITEESIHVAFG
jgi:hypothetical protein